MRNFIILLFITCLGSCMQVKEDPAGDRADRKIKKQVIKVAEAYVRKKIEKGKKSVSKDGLIVFSVNDTKCLIDPSRIMTGEIDEDPVKDAIVPLYYFRDQTLLSTEHVILLNKDGRYLIAKVLVFEMKLLAIKNREIIIETSKIASDSPYFGCEICKEVVKYKFVDGDTVRIK